MMVSRRGLLHSLAVSTAALPMGGCFGSENVTKRIKIIAKAEVNGRPVEGSTVMEITWRPRSDGGMNVDSLGEALVLELDGKGTVYVLDGFIGSDGLRYSSFWAIQITKTVGIKGATLKKHLPQIDALTGRFPYVPDKSSGPTKIPLIVTFANENDFRSIYLVKSEQFSSHFGSGIKFIGLEFETTNEPITKVLASRLPVLSGPIESAPKEILLKAAKDTPFKYSIGPKEFFSHGRY